LVLNFFFVVGGGGGPHVPWLKKIYQPCVIFKVLGPPWALYYNKFLSKTITNSLSKQTAKSITCEGAAIFILGNESKVGSCRRRGLKGEMGMLFKGVAGHGS